MFQSRTLVAALLAVLTLAVAPSLGAQEQEAPRRIEIEVDHRGYHPSTVRVRGGERVTLVFRRTTERGCGGTVVIPSHDIRRELPVGERVAITLSVGERDRLSFTCGMGMYRGALVVE